MLERDVSEVTGYPSGPAVTPDGRWLVSLGYSRATVTVYDAETLEPIAGPVHEIPCPPPHDCGGFDPFFLSNPHALVISPDGSLAVLASRSGVIALRLPSLALAFTAPVPGLGPTRHVVRDRTGENYYVSGENTGIARLNAAGEPQAFFGEAFTVAGIALARDEQELLVLNNDGRRFLALTAADLVPRLSVDLPSGFNGEAVVPIWDGRHTIIVGGDYGGEKLVTSPLRALTIDLATGSVASEQVLFEGGEGLIFLGDGNEWVDVGESTAIVPTGAGTVTIDTNHGIATLHPAADLQNDIPPCCDIARYPGGDRVVITNAQNNPGGEPGGRLIIYDVEEVPLPATD